MDTGSSPAPPDPSLGAALEAWFVTYARPLPWRRDRTPYRVWVSEVMLQQTRAATAARYFAPFVARFPDVHALARAPLDDVLKAWEGLGYYRRARSLHAAARLVVERHEGCLPDARDTLLGLPGLGSYTSAAIAAFAFGAAELPVDANVRRVGARVLGLCTPTEAALESAFRPWLAASTHPSTVAEAMIELGALTCTPRSPSCGACPLRGGCTAADQGDPERYPARTPRRTAPTRIRWASVAFDATGVWLWRRPEDALLGGLWGFPQHDERPPGEALGAVSHAYTHFRLDLRLVHVEGGAPIAAELEHVPWHRVAELALSSVDAKILARLPRDDGPSPPRNRVQREAGEPSGATDDTRRKSSGIPAL